MSFLDPVTPGVGELPWTWRKEGTSPSVCLPKTPTPSPTHVTARRGAHTISLTKAFREGQPL